MKNPESTEDYKRAIRNTCKVNGSYKKTDELVISNLAEIMSKRHNCEAEFIKTGGHSVIAREGAMPRKNPILQTWLDLTNAALPYFRELGLTPAARKKLMDSGQADNEVNIAEMLKDA